MAIITYQQALKNSMYEALANFSDTIVYGLGVTDHIGIFGTTKGLQEQFGQERVFDTPIAEDSMTGFAIGSSLGGLYPIHIHIRVDFLLLAMNQLINAAAKYRYMYGGLFQTPMLIRAVIGRSWGQGAQHSQSLQALFSHIPGLTVIMPSSAQAIEKCYIHAIKNYKNPVISLEHRLLYDYQFDTKQSYLNDSNPFDSYIVQEGSDITIVASSVMVQEAIKASLYIAKDRAISIEIIDVNSTTHINQNLIINSLQKTNKLIIADTSWASFGLTAEISRLVLQTKPDILKAPMISLCTKHSPCPTAKTLEYAFYPHLRDIVSAIYTLYYGNSKNRPLPTDEECIDYYKHFKGPF